jgi:hypothetical protein
MSGQQGFLRKFTILLILEMNCLTLCRPADEISLFAFPSPRRQAQTMKLSARPSQEKTAQLRRSGADSKAGQAFQFVDNRQETKQLKAAQQVIQGGAPAQLMKIGETSFSLPRDLNIHFRTDEAIKARIDAMTGNKNPEVFAEMKKVVKSGETFDNFDAFEAKVMGAFTDNPKEAEMQSVEMEGVSNVKGGPVSGLKKGVGGGWLAGSGANWHVHYDHAKCGNGPRINFDGRSKTDILAKMDEARGTGALSGKRLDDWNAARSWVDTNK